MCLFSLILDAGQTPCSAFLPVPKSRGLSSETVFHLEAFSNGHPISSASSGSTGIFRLSQLEGCRGGGQAGTFGIAVNHPISQSSSSLGCQQAYMQHAFGC